MYEYRNANLQIQITNNFNNRYFYNTIQTSNRSFKYIFYHKIIPCLFQPTSLSGFLHISIIITKKKLQKNPNSININIKKTTKNQVLKNNFGSYFSIWIYDRPYEHSFIDENKNPDILPLLSVIKKTLRTSRSMSNCM